MAPWRLDWILATIPLLVAGCGGDTSEDQTNSPRGNGSSGGGETAGGSGGAVGTAGSGGEPSTGGRGGAAGAIDEGGRGGAAGAISEGGTGGTTSYWFDVLTLERGPADGYCLQPGDILRGGIVYGETGDYGMSGAAFRAWDESRPDACAGTESPDCVISAQFQLILSDSQLAELVALLEALPEDRCELDETMECDPCVITTLVIDWTTYGDYCCGTQLSPGYSEAFEAVVNLLDDLAASGS